MIVERQCIACPWATSYYSTIYVDSFNLLTARLVVLPNSWLLIIHSCSCSYPFYFPFACFIFANFPIIHSIRFDAPWFTIDLTTIQPSINLSTHRQQLCLSMSSNATFSIAPSSLAQSLSPLTTVITMTPPPRQCECDWWPSTLQHAVTWTSSQLNSSCV